MPVYVGLRTVLARYLLPQLSCNKDVEEEKEEEEEEEEELGSGDWDNNG